MRATGRDNRTAAEAYTENIQAIEVAISKLREGLKQHGYEQAKAPKNWGFVGDAGHVLGLLEQAARFINGEEE